MKIATLLLAALVIPKLTACSISEICPHHGFAAARNFTVTVHHAGKPLPGALVKVIPDDGGLDIAETTEAAGSILFENLPPGNYHLSVSMLGITSFYRCFHVAKWALTANRTMTVNWGDDAPETRQISGRLTSLRTISYANGQHVDSTSVSGIQLTLSNALTGVRYQTTSSSPEGSFNFSSVPEGVYVLHSEADDRLRYYAGDLLIHLSPTAKRSELVVRLGGGGTDCGRALELMN
jgi:Carboxypeptidase regulatory-like domain